MADALSTTLVRVKRATPIDDIWSVVERDGGVVIEDLLASDTVRTINQEVEPSLQALAPGAKEEWFDIFFGANTKRLTHIVVSSPTFRNKVLQDVVVLGLGDTLLISGKVIHGGGANGTADEYRRGLSLSFCLGYLVPEQAFPFEVPLELARTLPAKTQQLLGFRSFHNYKKLGGSLWQHNYTELADYLDLD